MGNYGVGNTNDMRKCSECGKEFCIAAYDPERYAYKLNINSGKYIFCGYSCMSKFQKRKKERKLPSWE